MIHFTIIPVSSSIQVLVQGASDQITQLQIWLVVEGAHNATWAGLDLQGLGLGGIDGGFLT